MRGETLVLNAVDESGPVRVTAYCQHKLSPETRREVVAEMVKELHLTPNYVESTVEQFGDCEIPNQHTRWMRLT